MKNEENNVSRETRELMAVDSIKAGLPALYSGKPSEYVKPIRARHQKLTDDSGVWLKQPDTLTLNDTKKLGLFMASPTGEVVEVDGLFYNPTTYMAKVQLLTGEIRTVPGHLLGDKLDDNGYPKGVSWQRKLTKRFIGFLSATRAQDTQWSI